MKTIHPVVIRGGFGKNKDRSVKSGSFVLKTLSEKYFDPTDLLVDEEGWFVEGKKIKESELNKLGDVFISTLAEDNTSDINIRKKLERLNSPFIGSSTDSTLLSCNKYGSKELFKSGNIKTPRHEIHKRDANIKDASLQIFRSLGLPTILKPVSGNYSLGVGLVKNLTELERKLEEIFSFAERVLAEEFIQGREVSCLVIENFRNKHLYTFPIGEIIREGEISDEKIKRESKYGAVFPARITVEESKAVRNSAERAHRILGLKHYSRADFIVSPKGVYLLEINSSPEIDEESLLCQGLEAGGMPPLSFLNHIIDLAVEEKW